MNKNILFLCFISLILCKGPYQMENKILTLSERTFGYAKKEFKNLVVLFYNPENPYCREYMPEYENTASILKKKNFILSKIDCTKAEAICNKYKIESFPTIILFKKKHHIIFNGERKTEEIEKWLIENTKPNIKKITSKRELEKNKKYTRVFLMYFGNDEKVINEIILAERKIDDIPIFTCNSEELIKENVDVKKNESIAIFKTFDEKKNVFKDNITAKNIIKFVELYAYPKAIEFSKDTAHIILDKRNPALIIFSTKTERHYDDSINLFSYMWPRVKSKIKLFVCDIKDPSAANLVHYCNMTEKTIPKVYIVHAENENPTKYVMSGGINEENIMYFIKDWKKGKLKPFIRSEEVPINNNGDLFILVGTNYKKEVLENDKDVLILFVSPLCETCKDIEQKLSKLAKKLKPYNSKLLIAKMDATVNDVEGYQINKFPSIYFYPGNAKDKEPLIFQTGKNIDELYNFLKENSFNHIEEKYYENTDL